jgi:nitroimidazol reductase NimA-like FMN-containing flavoprotein (pyridoxamine 5'-phosphate oxidase superfamily)
LNFDRNVISFLDSSFIARIATSNSQGEPYISPIYFANDKNAIFFATETSTMKYKLISVNPRVAIVIDTFDASWLHSDNKKISTKERAVVIRGNAKIFTDGESKEYSVMYQRLFDKYPDYREQGWKKGESPIVKVIPKKVISWGI